MWQFPKRKRAHPEHEKQRPGYVPGRRTMIAAALGLLAFSLVANFFLAKRVVVAKQAIASQRRALAEMREPDDHRSEIAGKWYGLCPKDSIHSVDDFRRVVGADPLLAEHFNDFRWDRARMGKLTSGIWTHVTYRKGGRILTTRRVIRLPKGDGYITDGSRWVRTYCGNDYVLAGSHVQMSEGIDSDADRLADRMDRSKWRMDAGGLDDVPEVPEPHSFLLAACGLACLGLFRLARRH